MEYIVKWEIELTASSPQEAAELALECLRDDYGLGHVFTTRDESDICHSVDLDETYDNQVLPLTLDQFYDIDITLNTRMT